MVFLGEEGQFVVELSMDSCDLAKSTDEYRQIMNALKDAALAAIRSPADEAP